MSSGVLLFDERLNYSVRCSVLLGGSISAGDWHTDMASVPDAQASIRRLNSGEVHPVESLNRKCSNDACACSST